MTSKDGPRTESDKIELKCKLVAKSHYYVYTKWRHIGNELQYERQV